MHYQSPIEMNTSHQLSVATKISYIPIRQLRMYTDTAITCSSAFKKVKPFRSSMGIVSSSKSKTLKLQSKLEQHYQCMFEGANNVVGIDGSRCTCHSDHQFSEQLAQNHSAQLSSMEEKQVRIAHQKTSTFNYQAEGEHEFSVEIKACVF